MKGEGSFPQVVLHVAFSPQPLPCVPCPGLSTPLHACVALNGHYFCFMQWTELPLLIFLICTFFHILTFFKALYLFI